MVPLPEGLKSKQPPSDTPRPTAEVSTKKSNGTQNRSIDEIEARLVAHDGPHNESLDTGHKSAAPQGLA